MARSRRSVLKTAAASSTSLVVGLSGCLGNGDDEDTTDSGDGDGDAEVRAAFVNQWDPAEDNWVARHYEARQNVDDEFDWLSTAGSYAIPPSEVESVFRDYAEDGYDIIMGNTLTYMAQIKTVSDEYPDIAWENATGIESGDNLAYYQVRAYEGQYIGGIIAGMVTETDKIGFNAPAPVPYIFRQINGWTLGAKRVNPDVECEVNFIGEWADPSQEASSAQSLIDGGCDALSSTSNIAATTRTAGENEVWSLDRYMPTRDQNEDYYISSVLPSWEEHHRDVIQQVRAGEWEPVNRWYGFEEDWLEMDNWGKNVPEDAVTEAETAIDDIAGGMDVFEGTVFENWTEEELYLEMGDYVEGVIGQPP